nr:RecName: Full=Ribosome-inactivating protein trichokirin; AltName: Full=rRNA N-glycosidase [Trichosanthes kirilowii]
DVSFSLSGGGTASYEK